MTAPPPRMVAFTLVELLVVVAIIVVLIAMLIPALDRAIYQAQLVQCAANQKNIASGANTYALDRKRKYPPCHFVDSSSYPYALRAPVAFEVNSGKMLDDRPDFKGYIDLTWLTDPLCQKVDLSNPDPLSEEAIYASYPLFFGWYYKNHPGMWKMSDRWEVLDQRTPNRPVYKFAWLVTDMDIVANGTAIQATANHPDKGDVLLPSWAQAGRFDYGSNGTQQQAQGEAFNAGIPVTYSWWRNTLTHKRGPMDLNTASLDGSVIRTTDVPYNENGKDSRVARIPNIWDLSKPGVWINIPRP
jgi:competence protein ComGC